MYQSNKLLLYFFPFSYYERMLYFNSEIVLLNVLMLLSFSQINQQLAVGGGERNWSSVYPCKKSEKSMRLE